MSHAPTTKPFVPLRVVVVTVSDTRDLETDRSGAYLVESLREEGHEVVDRAIVIDDPALIQACVRGFVEHPKVDVVLVTGGTGLAARDVTPEAIAPLVSKPIPGFGELFRWLSFEEIGTSTIQSRAEAALCGEALVFLLPGSPKACRLAWEKILKPQLDFRNRPCNFVEFLPRVSRPTPSASST
jgi:molybdenum cofactor biosynthesis protein B